jgi:biopolymer transport protein ExbB/TolQ
METTTEQNAPSVARLAVKWGLISGFISLIYTLLSQMTGLAYNTSINWLSTVIGITIAVIAQVLAMKEYKETHEGYLTYGQGVGLGTLLSTVSGVVAMGIWTAYVAFIDNTFISKSLDAAREQWEKQGMTDEQMEQAAEMTEKFMQPGALFLFGIISSVIFGLIVSLIVSAVQQKKRPVF